MPEGEGRPATVRAEPVLTESTFMMPG